VDSHLMGFPSFIKGDVEGQSPWEAYSRRRGRWLFPRGSGLNGTRDYRLARD